MASGAPYCYRFRAPKNKEVTIQDLVRDKVTWNTDTLGDFIILRSNGLPVYNFCVAVDDALMGITHVLRCGGEGRGRGFYMLLRMPVLATLRRRFMPAVGDRSLHSLKRK